MLRSVPYRSPTWQRVHAFVAGCTDPVQDLLLWADVASGLARHSRIWALEGEGAIEAVAFAFPLWPELSAIGVRGRSPAAERALLAGLAATGTLAAGYVICDLAQLPLYEATGSCLAPDREVHMTLQATAWQPRQIPGVRPAELRELDAFYREYAAPAWNPLQFETGPAFVAEEDGRIVAAAGTHFAYAELAQLGNVLTAPQHRGRGHARRVTAAVTQALVERGHGVVSLFVAESNAPARHVYAELGFAPLRPVANFTWRARNSFTRA